MSPTKESVFAVCHFDSAMQAQQAIGELTKIGIASSAIQTVSSESLNGKSSSGLSQQFTTAGVQEDDATYLQQELRNKGGVIAIVRTDSSNEAKVDEIFSRYGGHESSARNLASGQDQTLQVVEEELVVGKRSISRGGMRVYSRLIETPVEAQVNLTEETVNIERHKVDRPISSSEIDALERDQVIEMTATGEEAVIGKKARVVEEVSIGKQTTARTETVRDTVRKTDVQVEKIDPEITRHFESDYNTNYGKSGEAFDTYAPAYQYGYQRANDPEYKGKSYSDVEPELRDEYESGNPGAWEKFKGAVQTGWNKVTGQD